MCDLPEEDLAEYLLWLELASSRASARATASPIRTRILLPIGEEPAPLPAEV